MLFRLPAVLAAGAAADTVYVCEGEKDVETLEKLGVVATCNAGGAGRWRDEYGACLQGAKRVVILPDNDQVGRDHAAKIAGSLACIGVPHLIVELPGLHEKGDVSDWVAAGGTLDQLRALARETTAETAASSIGLSDSKPESAMTERPIRPLADLLSDVCAYLQRYVVLPGEDDCRAIALWIAHTHLFAQFDVSPYLSVSSAEKQSGKTRLAELIKLLVPRPWLVVTPSEAVLYRKIEQEAPTLLLDEVDTIFSRKASSSYEGLRALLNAGHRRGTTVPRCVGEGKNIKLVEFPVFCPKAFFGIGKPLPDTVADRSIPIRLERRRADETVERFRHAEVAPIAEVLREGLAAWADLTDLRDAHPALPGELGDREQDCWEPLLAVADAAGGEWSRWSRQAAVRISTDRGGETDSWGIRLLRDIRPLYADAGADRLTSEDIVKHLGDMEESPWEEMSTHRLASRLRTYGSVRRRCASATRRPGATTATSSRRPSPATWAPTPGPSRSSASLRDDWRCNP